jgi:biopolymer transport protein ExbB
MLKKAQLLQLETLALHPSSRDISIQRCDLEVIVAEKNEKFCSTRKQFVCDKRKPVSKSNRSDQTPASTMKTLLTISLCSLALALTSLAQSPPPAQARPAAPGTNPAAQAPGNPAAAAQAPATNVPPGQGAAPGQPAAAGQPAAPGAPAALSPAAPAQAGSVPPGESPAVTTTISPAAANPPPAAEAQTSGGVLGSNWLIDKFHKGGPVMWPILIVSIIALTVVIERIFWWSGRWFRRDPKRIEKVFTAIEHGDTTEASRLSRGSRDPILRMMWNGLNHQHASLQGALQVAAGIEIKRAGRFLVVMDTLVTLAPLLGLLGTITGLIRSFSFLGNEELAVQAVTGGIAEALIATACGLGIAIFALIPFNFFTSRVSNLEFELQTAATNLEVMLGTQAAQHEVEIARTATTGKGSSI